MEYQEIYDKLSAILREDFYASPIEVVKYGTGAYGNTLAVKGDIFGVSLKKLQEEFDNVFMDARKGLVLG